MMKTSINFKAAKSDSEVHNFRKKTFDYIRKDLTVKNEYWMEEKISERVQKIEMYCKQKSGRKLQSNALPIREAVVVIKKNTTMQDLHDLSKKLEEELKIRIFQIAIHKDEGHYDKDSKEWKPNLHAHLVADWQDLETGKTLKHQSFHYSKMQDITAECLRMERGISGSKGRLEAIAFKIQKKEEEYEALNEKIQEMKSELNSKKFEDLIVKEADFLGFKKISTHKTIDNYEKAFKLYNSQLLKSKENLKIKSQQVSELLQTNNSLKKEVQYLKKKNSFLLSNSAFYNTEKENFLKSVFNTLEKAIQFERLTIKDTSEFEPNQLVEKMNEICKKVSDENVIPPSAFEEIFRNDDLVSQLFSLLNFNNSSAQNEDFIIIKNKKQIKR